MQALLFFALVNAASGLGLERYTVDNLLDELENADGWARAVEFLPEVEFPSVEDDYPAPPGAANSSVGLDSGINPAYEVVTWSTGDTVQAITVDSSGVYWVTALNPEGCFRTDTVTIDIFENPVIELTSGGTACEGEPVDITASVTADTTVAGVGWSTGEAGTTITVTVRATAPAPAPATARMRT